MSATAAGRGGLHWGGLSALVAAVALNLAVFCLAPVLLNGEVDPSSNNDPLLTAFLPVKPPPPPLEEEEEPPEPKPPPQMKIEKLRLKPLPSEQVNLETPQLDFEINPKLALGPAIAAPKVKTGFNISEVDRPPLVTGRIPPMYPYTARRRGIEGGVRVRFLVDKAGAVRHLKVVRANPAGMFEDSVLRSVGRWRFRPGVKDGRPVPVWVETTIRFKLEGRR